MKNGILRAILSIIWKIEFNGLKNIVFLKGTANNANKNQYLILETDSPYLAPAPHRGKRNESKYIIHIAQKLAEVQKTSIDEIANITTKNAKNLFQI